MKKQRIKVTMTLYKTKTGIISGSSYEEVRRCALAVYNNIRKRTKRKPYIRSAYFQRQKIFFDFFWIHLWQSGGYKERVKRLKYFQSAIEVLKHTRNEPISKENPHRRSEILHRFAGLTKDNQLFFVQVKEHKSSGRKYFMSCFPAK